MNFIVFDLEATCWEGGVPPSKEQEIIEIGAFRLNAYGEILDSFKRFVKPKMNPYLSLFCRQLTGIQQEDINRAAPFPRVMEDFQEWGYIFEEDYLLCSWGGFDQELLFQDCKYHGLDCDWLDHYINLKAQYHEINRLPRKRGLKSTLEAEGMDFIGDHHRALDDAANLVKIFNQYIDEWQF